jgi:hypothetical protein
MDNEFFGEAHDSVEIDRYSPAWGRQDFESRWMFTQILPVLVFGNDFHLKTRFKKIG